ncbi:MAG: PAS domain-containing sensor histidine kinase [Pseudomonadota bacterium]|nr:PAS domain-containing sensor histidine kinase [Pseudomonadota bacterium]
MPPSASAESFRVIAEIAGDVAWIVDCGSGLPTYISPAVETLLGYGVETFQRQLADPAASDGPDGPLRALCAGLPERLARLAAGDLSRLRLVRQFDVAHRDGPLVPLEVISSVQVDQAGRPTQLVGILRDLSARREHEAGQRRFASMLNHEFRTPLSSIDGAVQRLEVTGVNADQPTRDRYRRIATAVERLIGMLDEYLSPDRIEHIGARRPDDRIDPRQLLDEAALLVRAAGRLASVTAADLPAALRCQPQGLRLVLKVLVDNALQYAPADAPIALSGQCVDGGIELLVRDHGEGVPAADTEAIFAKSRRGSNAGARSGAGLGLYMARSVVEIHGGALSVRNALPQGAEFRVWLPLRELAGKNVASGGNRSDNSGNNHRLAQVVKNTLG